MEENVLHVGIVITAPQWIMWLLAFQYGGQFQFNLSLTVITQVTAHIRTFLQSLTTLLMFFFSRGASSQQHSFNPYLHASVLV